MLAIGTPKEIRNMIHENGRGEMQDLSVKDTSVADKRAKDTSVNDMNSAFIAIVEQSRADKLKQSKALKQ